MGHGVHYNVPVSAQSMSITSASQTRTCEGSTTLDGGGSDSCSSGSRRRIRQTAMLSSSMAVTRSRNAIQAGRKHYTARTQEYTARSHDTRSAIQAGRKHYTARTHSTQPDHTTQTLHQHPAYTHIYTTVNTHTYTVTHVHIHTHSQ